MKKLKSIPVSKVARASKLATTGMKIGGNYLKHYSKKAFVKGYDEKDLERDNAEDVYNCLSELKGSALKVAQMLSMDRNVMPESYTDKFAMAQYQAPPISSPLVRKLVKRHLGDAPENIFESFTQDAVRAASIGQVHKATYNGRDVAVKIQYPGVAESISSDLKMVRPFALKLLNLKDGEVKTYFQEIEKKMIEETDYVNEMEQGVAVSISCSDVKGVRFPEYIQKLCNDRIICMEWLKGKQIDEFFTDKIDQETRNKIGQSLWDFYYHQMHINKFIHADPHPGNFLVDDDLILNVIDFGCMKKIPKDFYRNYFATADKSLFDDEKLFRKNLSALEILREDDDKETRKFFSKSFNQLMRLAMAPFHVETFDFANEKFFIDLYETGEKISKQQKKLGYSHSRGSRHFIYTNRTYYGLYNILHLLKAKVKTGPLDPKALK
ncbi:MAG: AarF/ABC1/UbiB kinase family protein [Lentisphaeraceae bacterium]|nr:AarF/ABC1/UbiB kinase family protein [Lentisphaeraceae bacterium]